MRVILYNTLLFVFLATCFVRGQNLSEAEYFFDNDPGVGNGVPLPSFSPLDTVDFNFQVDISSLSVGFHDLFIRFKDQNGKWGIYEGRTFYVTPNVTLSQSSDLFEAEYFFDTDPGVGNGVALPSFSPADTVDLSFQADISSLSDGYHNLFIRFKDQDGKWGIYEGHTFYVIPDVTLSQSSDLFEAEYFFDSDPGVGNGVALPSFSPSDTVDLSFQADISSLSDGYHNLFIRFKDQDGKWGIYEGKTFYVTPQVTLSQASDLLEAEYFFDTDPGVGNGIALPSFSPSDTVDLNFQADVSSLALGLHNLFIRYKDEDGKWGIYEGREFEIANCSSPTAEFTTASQVCLGDAVTMTDNSTNIDPTATYEWDIDSDGTADYTTVGDITHTFSASGTYSVTLTVINDGGCTDTYVQTVEVVDNSGVTETQTACDSYTWSANGTTYTTSGQYTETLTGTLGCDSIVTLDLTINNVNNGVTITNDTELNADQTGADYQWLDCDNNFAPITGETNQQFDVLSAGNYAVEVTINNCSDTSDCIVIDNLKIGDQSPLSEITVYPNPTDGKVNIDLGALQDVTIELSTIEGKVVSREKATQSLHMIDIKAPKGLFIIKVSYGSSSKHFKVVKM